MKPTLKPRPLWLCAWCNNAVKVGDGADFECCGGDPQSIIMFETDAFNLLKTVKQRLKGDKNETDE